MPPRDPRPGGRFRRIFYVLPLPAVILGIYAFLNAGRFLAPEQPLARADAIFVFAGTVAERPLEAVDLYRAGYAPVILMTRATMDHAILAANQRGARIPSEYDLGRQLVLQLGVPPSALIESARDHDNTSEEAETLKTEALSRGWKKVILVTSSYHLRRVSLACRRQLRGTGIEIVLRGTRHDETMPAVWWKRRSDIRWVVSEFPKLLAYSIGLGA